MKMSVALEEINLEIICLYMTNVYKNIRNVKIKMKKKAKTIWPK